MAGDKISDWAEEKAEEKRQIHLTYGWYFLAEQVSGFTRISFFEVMERPAREVLSLVQIMTAKAEYNSIK